jgi:hypothetical protein
MAATKTKTKMRAIAKQPVAPSSADFPIPEIYLQTDESIVIEGDASQEAMYCTVTISRPYLSLSQPAWTRTLFATVTDGAWAANLGTLSEGRYLLSACRDDEGGDGDVVWLLVGPPSEALIPFLALGPAAPILQTSAPKVRVFGTVSTANNPVACTLTPIDADGNYTGGTIYNNNATVTFKSWNVAFATPVTHLYSFQASANGEGTVSEPLKVP